MTLPTSINLVVPVAGYATHGQYALVEACVAAGTEIPAHVAHQEDVVLHVLHGELAVSVDRVEQTVIGGGSVALPRGVPRRIAATRPSRVLALIAPAGLEQRVHEELVVAGARPQRLAFSGVDALTASERRVAELAVRGLRNREIAETLFVSLKTVEVHLGRAYTKLGIKGRSQLEAALAT